MATAKPPSTEGSTTTTTTTTASSTSADAARRRTEHLAMPSRNPLPLSASQEAQVREVFNARVRKLCADEIQAFADCARNRTFSIPFACRALSHAMNGCMSAHATAAEHDRAREEWFAGRVERARERERKERRKLEQERFHREWWGLPDKSDEDRRREEDKLSRGERIGGYRRGGGGGSAAAAAGGGGGGGSGSADAAGPEVGRR